MSGLKPLKSMTSKRSSESSQTWRRTGFDAFFWVFGVVFDRFLDGFCWLLVGFMWRYGSKRKPRTRGFGKNFSLINRDFGVPSIFDP